MEIFLSETSLSVGCSPRSKSAGFEVSTIVFTLRVSGTVPLLHLYIFIGCRGTLRVQSDKKGTYIQGDQKGSMYRMIKYKKHAKIFETFSITYYDNIVRVRDNRWR
jgi:hypothetical protein